MKQTTPIYIWGVVGIVIGCLLVKSDQYIYPQIKHWDDRTVCKESATTLGMDYSYSAYQDVCKVKYKDTWMSFRHWKDTYSPEAIAAQQRLEEDIRQRVEMDKAVLKFRIEEWNKQKGEKK